MIGSEKSGKLGRVFVNFGNPINTKEYLKNISMPKLDLENIDEVSLRISEKLYKEQQEMNSVSLSQIIATLIL
jgi:glycerol-3-phosphate O-acyltransferase